MTTQKRFTKKEKKKQNEKNLTKKSVRTMAIKKKDSGNNKHHNRLPGYPLYAKRYKHDRKKRKNRHVESVNTRFLDAIRKEKLIKNSSDGIEKITAQSIDYPAHGKGVFVFSISLIRKESVNFHYYLSIRSVSTIRFLAFSKVALASASS